VAAAALQTREVLLQEPMHEPGAHNLSREYADECMTVWVWMGWVVNMLGVFLKMSSTGLP
jgi:hypothetical protein